MFMVVKYEINAYSLDEAKQKKLDKIYNYVLIGVGIATAGLIIWKIIDTFL